MATLQAYTASQLTAQSLKYRHRIIDLFVSLKTWEALRTMLSQMEAPVVDV